MRAGSARLAAGRRHRPGQRALLPRARIGRRSRVGLGSYLGCPARPLREYPLELRPEMGRAVEAAGAAVGAARAWKARARRRRPSRARPSWLSPQEVIEVEAARRRCNTSRAAFVVPALGGSMSRG